MKVALHIVIAGVLTVLTQIGGVAWMLSRLFRRKTFGFLAIYIALSAAAVFIAPLFGRVPLPCAVSAQLQVHSPVYCALNRHYVTPELRSELEAFAQAMARKHAGTQVRVLDGNFPFFNGFPLLPHLSHDDGRKVDVALFYKDASDTPTHKTPSPLGYFAFEQGPSQCRKNWPTLRWNMGWLRPLWRDLELDQARTKSALLWLAQNQSVEKVFVEPHLKSSLNISAGKVRFQGCRVARHDDHIHFQL